MEVRRIEREASIGAGREDVVVCIRGGSGPALESVLAQTEPEVPLVICGEPPARASSGRMVWVAANVTDAIAAAAPADVVLVRSDCAVPAGWLAGLRHAAYVDSRVATATPLTMKIPEGVGFDAAAASVSSGSLRIRPRLAAAGDACVYVRRSALELVGPDDLSERCVAHGLAHVLADDVLLQGEFGSTEDAPEPAARRALAAARRAVAGLSILIDGRVLRGPMNGSKVHVLELIAAVARTEQARVTVIVPDDLSDEARPVLERLPALTLTTPDDLRGRINADVVHRPVQLNATADLSTLAQLGERLVITQQDLIGYYNPTYWRSLADWQEYRQLTRSALAAADRVVFFSAHARDEALGEELVEPHRATVVAIGVDHFARAGQEEAAAPPGADRIPEDVEVMLCLGADYRHKNRVFALRIVDELQQRHGWRGRLVLAGQNMPCGSSKADEQRLLADRPQVADAVLELGAVSEAEKAWLLNRADLVLYPTVYEGFGLVPFESADHGVPCLWAPGTALSEVLPDGAAGIVPWQVGPSAQHALELLRDSVARAGNIESVRAAATRLRWDDTAQRLLELYRSVCDAPASRTGEREAHGPWMWDGISEDAMRLVGPGGALPPDLDRPLLALATHPRVGTPVFRAIKAGYRASYRWRRIGSRRER